MAQMLPQTSVNNELVKKVDAIVDEIENHLAEATRIYFKYERSLDEYQYKRMNSMGMDNCVGNACFYDLSMELYLNNKEKAKEAYKYAYDNIIDLCKKVEAYKPTFGLCEWHGLDADLWLPLTSAKLVMLDKLVPLMEDFFKERIY